MKIKQSNSSINSTISNSNKYLTNKTEVCITHPNCADVIAEYRHCHNKFVPLSMHKKMMEQTNLGDTDVSALRYGLKHATIGDISSSTEGLYKHGLLLESQLASPQTYGCYPIPDKLHFTLNVTAEELENLYRNRDAIFEKSLFKCWPIKHKRQNGQFHKNKLVFRLKSCPAVEIHVFLGDNAKERATKHNLLRIEFIPSRLTPEEVKSFFSALKNSKCITNYKETMKAANVSRCDIAIDFLMLPTPLVIVDKPRVKHFSNHSKHKQKDLPFVQTMNIGNTQDSHSVVYAKTEKLLEGSGKKSKYQLPVLVNDDGNPLAVTRYEYVYRPQQSGSTLRLDRLDKMGDAFKSVEIYRPDAIGNLKPEEREKALKNGFMIFWKNTISEAAFKERKNIFQRHSMCINRSEFKKLQEKVLKKLCKCIISPDK